VQSFCEKIRKIKHPQNPIIVAIDCCLSEQKKKKKKRKTKKKELLLVMASFTFDRLPVHVQFTILGPIFRSHPRDLFALGQTTRANRDALKVFLREHCNVRDSLFEAYSITNLDVLLCMVFHDSSIKSLENTQTMGKRCCKRCMRCFRDRCPDTWHRSLLAIYRFVIFDISNNNSLSSPLSNRVKRQRPGFIKQLISLSFHNGYALDEQCPVFDVICSLSSRAEREAIVIWQNSSAYSKIPKSIEATYPDRAVHRMLSVAVDFDLSEFIIHAMNCTAFVNVIAPVLLSNVIDAKAWRIFMEFDWTCAHASGRSALEEPLERCMANGEFDWPVFVLRQLPGQRLKQQHVRRWFTTVVRQTWTSHAYYESMDAFLQTVFSFSDDDDDDEHARVSTTTRKRRRRAI
jgi:hypothetical protein